ncbi:MAG: multidrug efflux MFS transporter [Syntrophomonas sp.]
MPIWKRNLLVCWFGMFVVGIGMSQIAPVLPLYIRHLGVNSTTLIEQFSGIAFGVTFIVSAVFSPIWGRAADKWGRKPMLLRASLGMALVVFSMGFARNVYELIGLRLLLGVITGYSTACTTLIATQTEAQHAGWALGTLSTSSIAGSLLGPVIGGYIAENFGLPDVFFITGALVMISFMATALFVKESFTRRNEKSTGLKDMWNDIPEKSLTIMMFVTLLVISMAFYSIEPIITVYVAELSPGSAHVALLAGITFSAAGLANIIAAPRLGRISDKTGPHIVMLGALIAAGLFFIPQALVRSPWQLIACRFLVGLAAAGLIPSVNTLIKKITPDLLTGSVFGFTMSAMYLGAFGGAVLGGQLAALWGIRSIFLVTSTTLLINAVMVYFKVYKKPGIKELILQKA